MVSSLTEKIKAKSKELGFILAGITTCDSPAGYGIYEAWLAAGHHGGMEYLASERARLRRKDPKEILPECKSILVLALPYEPVKKEGTQINIASYALGADYHDIIPEKLKAIVDFIEAQVGHPVPNRYYTDTGPVLERELAKRAGLGWVGKNSMLIHPRFGSTFFLAEIFLGIDLEADEPFNTDHCGTCTRCIDACPTQCILPGRTLDARRCISYLTIELKDKIPEDLRPLMKNWAFGCDVCQQACPWNRFSQPADKSLQAHAAPLIRTSDLLLTPAEFNQRFRHSPLKRAKRRGVLRNLAVASGNTGNEADLPLLRRAAQDDELLVRDHAQWAIRQMRKRKDHE